MERRKIAWSRINPKLKSLASEDYGDRETNLFGPGFLEKASKRLEAERTLDKVSHQGKQSFQQKRPRYTYDKDRTDLRSFLSKGASVQWGNSKTGRHVPPHSSYTRFKNNRYFHKPHFPRDETNRKVEAKDPSK